MITFKPKQLIGSGILAATVFGAAGYQTFAENNKPHEITVQFDRGTRLDSGAEKAISRAVRIMFTNDAYTAKVVGHTGTQGSHDANVMLSEQRAETIKKEMVDREIKPDRIGTLGVGGAEPLERKENESTRAFQSRLSRAVIYLRRE